jgi:glycosyltransferase involved in cell wall biosynthesis
MIMDKKLLSIICPVYNEQDNIIMFYERIQKVIEPLNGQYEFEIIFTNNRSTDDSYKIVCNLHKQDKRVNLLTFSRNFGYQASILAGLTHASGDASVVIDVDCEDPPELIWQFIEKWEEGYDVVYGIRKKRQESRVIQWMRNFFYWILHKFGDYEVVMNMAEFSLITRDVRQEILNNKSTFPFLRTEIGYTGFNRIGVDYIRQSRQHGKTHYNFLGMSAFAIGGILSSSTFFLRLSALIGMFLLPMNLVLLFLDLTEKYSKAFEILVTLDLMYLVFFMAVLSIYNARIYKDGVQRPVFIVDWKYSFLEDSPPLEKSHE